MTAAALLHAGSTLAMTGLIWFVQVVHYPLFRFAASGDFPQFADSHQRRTTALVLPLMTIELVTAVVLALRPSAGSGGLALVGLALLGLIWLSTALVQVPLHRKLGRRFDSETARRLVATNWIRTAAWSLRSLVALRLIAP